MFNAALLRPGTATGVYPQRGDDRPSLLDRFADNIVGFFRQNLHVVNPRYKKFVKDVNVYSQEIRNIDLPELKQRVDELRPHLYGKGLEYDLVAQAFALIREIAFHTLKMRHHDVQLCGAWSMLQGKVAEMETGEGKTLTATLPACAAALAGIPVHIVTVNDFLVERDSAWMRPVYEALGLTVGSITENLNPDERRAAYACDICYCTNKQLVFDYLKDRLLLSLEDRKLHLGLEGLYKARPKTSQLLMRGLCFAIVDEADSVLIDEARTPLIISSSNQLEQEEQTYKNALKIAKQLEHPRDFTVDERSKFVELTDFGKAKVTTDSRVYGGIWSSAKRRNEIVSQALAALHLYILDKHYLVKEGKVHIIDEFSGRVMGDRSWEKGLHQLIEAKERCEITGRQETLARISYQKFFRRYLNLAGMTGTAQEVAGEMWSVYRLKVAKIPTHKKVKRKHLQDAVYVQAERKWSKVVAAVKRLHEQKRPVLIGTKTVANSEHLSQLLNGEGLVHRVLNARQDQQEAEIIAQAGKPAMITVATNMAGRGTDIKISSEVAELGGLHVLATERHEARRIDRQLYGRCGRQGDPGTCQSIVSLEDELLDTSLGKILRSIFRSRLPSWLAWFVVAWVQKKEERYQSKLRRDLLKQDDQLEDMLAFSGRGE